MPQQQRVLLGLLRGADRMLVSAALCKFFVYERYLIKSCSLNVSNGVSRKLSLSCCSLLLAARVQGTAQRVRRRATAPKCHESRRLRLLGGHVGRTFSQENRALPGEQQDMSPLQLSAKEQQISKLNNKPPKLGLFCSRVLEEHETGIVELTALWISPCNSAPVAEKWQSAAVAEPFQRLQRYSTDLLVNVKLFYQTASRELHLCNHCFCSVMVCKMLGIANTFQKTGNVFEV